MVNVKHISYFECMRPAKARKRSPGAALAVELLLLAAGAAALAAAGAAGAAAAAAASGRSRGFGCGETAGERSEEGVLRPEEGGLKCNLNTFQLGY